MLLFLIDKYSNFYDQSIIFNFFLQSEFDIVSYLQLQVFYSKLVFLKKYKFLLFNGKSNRRYVFYGVWDYWDGLEILGDKWGDFQRQNIRENVKRKVILNLLKRKCEQSFNEKKLGKFLFQISIVIEEMVSFSF